MEIFSIIIIKSKYRFLLELSLGVTIIISVLLVARNNLNAQTLESTIQHRKFLGESPQIMVGKDPADIKVNEFTNKIYIANKGFASNSVSVIDSDFGNTKSIRLGGVWPQAIAIDEASNKIYIANAHPISNSVSVIDGYNDRVIKEIPVGKDPLAIAAFPGRIYVANTGSNSVSVIDGYNDRVIKEIPVGKSPWGIAIGSYASKIYVANMDSDTVSVINGSTNTKEHDIPVGDGPFAIAIGYKNMIYVANRNSNTVSVINGSTNTKEHDIPVGDGPVDIAVGPSTTVCCGNKIYVANIRDDTVSVINSITDTKDHDIPVGIYPKKIAYDEATNMTYVVNLGYVAPASDILPKTLGTVSVIDGSSDKVAAGVTFNVNPANSGKIVCNKAEYPTNTYVYVDVGTNCMVQPNKNFEFNTWVVSPLTNRNSSIPLDSSGNLTVNRYGVFTVNFKPLPPPIPPEYLYLIISVIVSSVIGWSIPSIFGWFKARTQLKHLEECMASAN